MQGHTLMREALFYGKQGLLVFPLAPNAKVPLRGSESYKQASNDAPTIERWWREHANANIGVSTGGSNLVVVDIDPRNGGRESFQKLVDEIGLETFLAAPTVHTPSGGLHYWFCSPSDTTVRSGTHALGTGIDVKASKAYVVAPSSSLGTHSWSWESADGYFSPPLFPASLRERVRHSAPSNHLYPGEFLESGRRNVGLTSQAGTFRRNGHGLRELKPLLQVMNKLRCRPPLTSAEVDRIATSVAQYPPGIDGGAYVVRRLRDLTTCAEIKVANVIADYARNLGGSCSPSNYQLMKMTGLSSRAVYKAVTALETCGFLKRTHRGREAPIYSLT